MAVSKDRAVEDFRRDTPSDVIVLGTTYVEEYGIWFVPSLLFLACALVAIGAGRAFLSKPRSIVIWSYFAIAFIVIAASAFYAWEWYGWRQYFKSIGDAVSVGHTSILWENPVFDITNQIIARGDFIGIMLLGKGNVSC